MYISAKNTVTLYFPSLLLLWAVLFSGLSFALGGAHVFFIHLYIYIYRSLWGSDMTIVHRRSVSFGSVFSKYTFRNVNKCQCMFFTFLIKSQNDTSVGEGTVVWSGCHHCVFILYTANYWIKISKLIQVKKSIVIIDMLKIKPRNMFFHLSSLQVL